VLGCSSGSLYNKSLDAFLDFVVHLVESLLQSVEENGSVMRLEYQRGTQTNSNRTSTSRLNTLEKNDIQN
jgi:hypothetical protein